MHTGYIKLWRKIQKTSFYKKPNALSLAIHLLLDCNHEPQKFIFNGNEETINRGQLLTGLYKLKDTTGLSLQNLRTSLKILANSGFLTSKVTNRFRVISIGKYNEYQGELTSKVTIHQQSTNNPLTTNKNDKNVKNEKNTTITVPDKPDTDSGKKPVNWQNCKTDLQKVIATYVRVSTPRLYAPGACTQAQATAIFKVQGKAAAAILAQAGDADTACRVVELAATYYYNKGLDWSLYAVSKSTPDFLNKIIKEKSYGTNR